MRESVPRAWREAEYRQRLVGSRCAKCSLVRYPPRIICPKCGSREHEEFQLPRVGRVLTYTVIRKGPVEFSGQEPYIVAMVELGENMRILSQLTDVSPEDVKTGMEVEAVLRKYREDSDDGVILYGIKFRPRLRRKAP